MEIDQPATQKKDSLFARGWGWLKALLAKSTNKAVMVAKSTKKVGQDDPRRVIHSLKVGLALTLVSLVYYMRPLYEGFGVSGMWAVLTVVVVFEFSVGGTLSRCLNRGFATLFAGALGLGAQHLASLFGDKGEPVVLGLLVFLLATASSFTRFIPRIKARYDYGVLIFILTFSLVSVSGYRMDELLKLAHQRLSTILIGGATCIIISLFVCPVWAGEDLHKLIASNLEKLANYLEGFEGEYFPDSDSSEESTVTSKVDKALDLQGYKSVLNSKSTEESLANLARWEPGHGLFGMRHPWKQYLKIGALSRQCAYHIEALNGINTDIQAPLEFRNKIRESTTKMSSESSKALKALASAIQTMTDTSAANTHVEMSKTAIKELKIALKDYSVLPEKVDHIVAIIPIASVTSMLIEITRCVERISESVHELASLAHFKGVEPTVSPEKPHLLHRGSIKPVLDGDDHDDHVIITVHATDNVQGSVLENEIHHDQAPKANYLQRRLEV
ncbi:aluminum-activated malate transporter 8 [Juglans microcarpa x Juglans regia]|uniref:aluminum-activated malate transporter 8 n=1 Tax=Juglans microcarpa x Juglans regia TaxID=2249226 RepID=UPI001B7EF249|nr:aluminum-activated malate transporter 8 [Juglans microcarpa x Juglans regia]